MNMEPQEINRRLDLHPPRTNMIADKMDAVRAEFKNLAVILNNALPEGREKSLAFTHLEDTLMWAIKSIACHDSNLDT